MFEMEPLTEIKVLILLQCIAMMMVHDTYTQVGSDVSLKSLTRSADINNPHLWYAQDSNGAIWRIDIVVSHTVSYQHINMLLYQYNDVIISVRHLND